MASSQSSLPPRPAGCTAVRRLCFLVGLLLPRPVPAQAPVGPLVVFNAGSLAYPFRELLRAFGRIHPGIRPMQESSGSLEAARKLTELGKIPDVIAVADHLVIAKLLMRIVAQSGGEECVLRQAPLILGKDAKDRAALGE